MGTADPTTGRAKMQRQRVRWEKLARLNSIVFGEVKYFFRTCSGASKILVLACFNPQIAPSLVLRVKLVLIWHRFFAVWIELAKLRLFWWSRARSRVLEELSDPREHQKHATTCSVFGWHNWLFQTTRIYFENTVFFLRRKRGRTLWRPGLRK